MRTATRKGIAYLLCGGLLLCALVSCCKRPPPADEAVAGVHIKGYPHTGTFTNENAFPVRIKLTRTYYYPRLFGGVDRVEWIESFQTIAAGETVAQGLKLSTGYMGLDCEYYIYNESGTQIGYWESYQKGSE